MRYGFVIDNRKCIGCHACTTACKSEHQVPVGVNRTWVKQIEKGEFPNSRRLFSVMRCNHCTDAPCVEICPVEALYYRDDGIVDFDKDRCIGCKSCMQACPYDALYIDPENHTAAKCNYCAHRIDIGLEPACVNVCPEHAIISGDMEDPTSEIAVLLSRQQVKTRKPEKATMPNLFYIDADDSSLVPSATEKSDQYLWSSQSMGVGHYAKEAEKMAFSNGDIVTAVLESSRHEVSANDLENGKAKSIDLLMGTPRRNYDAPDKGVLWGWEVSAYVWTKAISSGVMIALFLGWMMGIVDAQSSLMKWGIGIGVFFLGATGLLLVKDLDRPDRFLNVLLRPQWGSWLVRGGYAISIFGGLMAILFAALWFEWTILIQPLLWLTALSAVLVSVYTAFLFAQAKGRDFWQSPTLALHMLIHSVMAGAAASILLGLVLGASAELIQFFMQVMAVALGTNLLVMLFELTMAHPTADAKRTVKSIVSGRYRNRFWFWVVLVGNVLPLVLALAFGLQMTIVLVATIAVLIGIYMTEHIWVEAPQRIPLS